MSDASKHSALLLVNQIADNPTIFEQVKSAQNPADVKAALMPLALKAIAEKENPLQTDKWIYRGVVFFLGMTIWTAVIGAIYLSGHSKVGIPEILTALGSAAVGALAGLLAPSPAAKG